MPRLRLNVVRRRKEASYNEREPNAEADNSFTASVGRAAILHIFRTILLPEMPFYAYGYQVLPQHETRHKRPTNNEYDGDTFGATL